jgi:DNA adenine methylase
MSQSTAGSSTKTLLPPLKWAGGKRWLVPKLRELWVRSGKKCLIEPFCGGLAVALGLQPEQAVLIDINKHLINFYKMIQEGLSITMSMRNDSGAYYAHRTFFNDLIRNGDDWGMTAASIFYYLNRTGFNGLCRFNSDGFFNVPFGKYKTISYRQDFSEYAACLQRWAFYCGDFENVLCDGDDFLYLDPPYDVEFTKYSPEGFTWKDQERLAKWAVSQRCPVVASNQATPRIISLYEKLGFEIALLDGPRRISCDGDRRPAREIFAIKNI